MGVDTNEKRFERASNQLLILAGVMFAPGSFTDLLDEAITVKHQGFFAVLFKGVIVAAGLPLAVFFCLFDSFVTFASVIHF